MRYIYINLILMFLIVINLNANENKDLFDKELKKKQSKINKDLPMRLNDMTDIISTKYNSPYLYYKYRLMVDGRKINRNKTMNKIKERVLLKICKEEDLKLFFDYNKKLKLTYIDASSRILFSFLITKKIYRKSCKKI